MKENARGIADEIHDVQFCLNSSAHEEANLHFTKIFSGLVKH